jgi:hypothetical protein
MVSPTSPSPTSTLPPPYNLNYRHTCPIFSPHGQREFAGFTSPTIVALPSPPLVHSEPFIPPARSPTIIGTTVTTPEAELLRTWASTPIRSRSVISEDPLLPFRMPCRVIDPYTEALAHTDELKQLCHRCSSSDHLRTLHMGELLVSLLKLLRRSRQLEALALPEEHEQLEQLVG